ncbi:MAG: 50S ribosomal protein L9 [Nitrospira sp.]|nr:50S ribosomal protein L9 [Nitrospira sp.]
MKVILKENVDKLGRMGDLVEVSNGYARNYLIPKKLATAATDRNVKALEHEKRLIAEKQKKERKAAEELAQRIRQTSITIPVQTGEEQEGSKIFGSVTNKDIVESLAKEGVTVDKHDVLLEKPIKELGKFMVSIKLHPNVTAEVEVSVVKS